MPNIPGIAELVAALERALRSALTFFGGMLAGRAAEQKKVDKAKDKADEEQAKNDTDFELRKRDGSRRRRLLDLIRRDRGND